MTKSSVPTAVGPSRTTSRAVRLGLAAVMIVIEVLIANVAANAFVVSTVPQDQQDAVGAAIILSLCSLPVLAVAAAYWTIGRSRIAAGLLAVAAAGTAVGLWTWMATVPLVVIAIIVPLFQRIR